jgi:glycosyltransferase involved in cell wall biosynthesis
MTPLVTIAITNFNYERFLEAAIESALAQTLTATEVIVVDDGSTDESASIVARHAGRVVPILKPNGGMASGYNAAFARARGAIVIFLDSDDLLEPTAAERAIAAATPGASKVHWPLRVIDADGRATGERVPGSPLVSGDFRGRTIEMGPDAYPSPPTSGNAWTRAFLERVLPMPEPAFRQHADSYLATLAGAFGRIEAIDEPQGSYRVHGLNDYASRSAREKNRRNLAIFERRAAALASFLRERGLAVDPARWRAAQPYYGWMRRLDDALRQLDAAIPVGSSFVLMDEAQWADRLAGSDLLDGRRSIPFLESNGQFFGPPPDDATAIRELERMRALGAAFLVVGWPAFWWLDQYRVFADHLRSRFSRILETDLVTIFRLDRSPAGAPP